MDVTMGNQQPSF